MTWFTIFEYILPFNCSTLNLYILWVANRFCFFFSRFSLFQLLTLLVCITIAVCVNGQSRRVRIRPRPIQRQPEEEREIDAEIASEDNTPQPAIQYYTASRAHENEDDGRLVLVADDDYNGPYGRPTSAAPRARADYIRPAAKATAAPRSKEPTNKEPPVQTIRNYSKVNDDGSFTFGYEAADGSFKEETRGTDCVVRGKYGYVDPDGNKREFTYVSGNPCDPNNPEHEEEEKEEESDEPENVPVNFPRRPSARPIAQRPVHTTTAAPTTVFQNTFSSAGYSDDAEEPEDNEQEQPEPIQLLQQRQRVPVRTQSIVAPQEVAIRQRPRVSFVNTTPAPAIFAQSTPGSNSVSITPRPSYRFPSVQSAAQTPPPATTYRPQVQFFTQKPAPVAYTKPAQVPLPVEPIIKSAYASTRKPIDFTAELAKFQQEHNAITTTVAPRPQIQKSPSPATGSPIYQTQLVYDPTTGQYAQSLVPQSGLSSFFQSTSGNQFEPSQSGVTLEQLQNRQPVYQRPQIPASTRSPLAFPQFNQQVYQKENENLQVHNSQQLFAQQQHLQQQQLQQDRIEATKRLQSLQNHRFQLSQSQAQPLRQVPSQSQHPGFYYVQQPHHPTLFHWTAQRCEMANASSAACKLSTISNKYFRW